MLVVCFAASAGVATPLGYPTKLIVFGPDGHEFPDVVKIGTIMNVRMWILTTLFIPLFYPS